MSRYPWERLAETHGSSFELLRHFLSQFFASETVTAPGQTQRAAIRMASAVIPAALLMIPVFKHRYLCLQVEDLRGCPQFTEGKLVYHAILRADEMWLVAIAICATALAASMRWNLLFPDLRDLRTLGPLPLSIRQHFVAKFGAASVALLAFILMIAPAPALAFAWLSAGPFGENASVALNALATAAAMGMAAISVFFALVALQGVALALAPLGWIRDLAALFHAAVVVGSVCSLPFLWRQNDWAQRWPPSWFVCVADAIRGVPGGSFYLPVMATAAPFLIAMALYFLGAGRYQRLLAEAPRTEGRRPLAGIISRIADFCFPEPAERGLIAFVGKALFRSSRLRMVLLVFFAVGMTWAAASMIELFNPAPLNPGHAAFTVCFTTLVAAAGLILGSHRIFSIPSDLAANWIFKVNPHCCDLSWLGAVDRLIVWCGIVPVYVCALPAAFAAAHFVVGVRLLLLSFAFAVIILKLRYRSWFKAPFTCSYIPAKMQLWQIVIFTLAAPLLLAAASDLLDRASRNLLTSAAVLSLEAAALWRLSSDRAQRLETNDPVFEEMPEPDVNGLSLSSENRGTGEAA